MANKIDLLGWAVLFLTLIIGVLGYGIIRNDKMAQYQEIQNYNRQIVIEPVKEQKYFGYITFPKYQVSRLIEYGNPNNIIEKYNIGIFGTIPESLNTENIILVGHNRPNQFAVVPKLKMGEVVTITHKNKEYQYRVFHRQVISSNDVSFLKKIHSKTLILITCLDDASKRIVIFCKLQEMR